MAHHGDIRLGNTLDLKFTTIDSTGLPVTLAGTPAIAAYPDNSTTEVTAGITLTVDFDTRTGLHNVRVVATSGNGYVTATEYTLVLTAGTVAGISVVGYVVGSFSIEKRSALMPTTADRTLDVSATGEAGVDWANVGSPTTTVGLSGTTVKTATDVETDTADIQTRLPAALVSGRMDSNVQAAATGVIASTTFAAGAIDAAAIAANAIGASELASDVVTDIWQGTALTEAYAADGATATPAQLLYMIWAGLAEFAISGTTITAKKLDGTTTAMTFTLDDGTNPTSRTRAT